jgi:hypothetical protein
METLTHPTNVVTRPILLKHAICCEHSSMHYKSGKELNFLFQQQHAKHPLLGTEQMSPEIDMHRQKQQNIGH